MAARLWARGQLKAPLRFPPDQATQDAQAAEDQTDEALAAFGLRAELPPLPPAGEGGGEGRPPADTDTPLYLWPENWPVWCLWRDVETQWHAVGMGSGTGLDYPGVWSVIDRRFRRRERKTVFYLVQAMEEVTVAEWRARDALRARQ